MLQSEAARGPDGGQLLRPINGKQLAWFFCFADPNTPKALEWAHKAYAVEPNAPAAAALLAYALSMTDQIDYAMIKPLLASFENNQIADLVQAKIFLHEGKTDEAANSLTLAIAKDPGSLAAEQARRMLRQQGRDYIPQVDTNALTTFLAENLGQPIAPEFAPPKDRIEVQFNIRGNEFSYGTSIEGTVAILNRASEPLVLTANGLIRGQIRVDARVTAVYREDGSSADGSPGFARVKRVPLREIPNVVSRTVRTELAVPARRSLVTSFKLSAGQLGQVLATYPQASLEMEFTLYLDPVVDADGLVRSRLADLPVITATATRPGVVLTGSYVRNRFNSISTGQQGQKIVTAQLFTGLLREQQAMAQHGTLYPYRYRDWLADLLRSALVTDSGLLLRDGAESWVVKVHTMADMLSLSIGQDMAEAVSKNLNHPRWPVRLMAVYLLAHAFGDDFDRVLDWVSEYDTSEMVREMAAALQSERSARSTTAAAPLSPIP
jgi:hypothetical protein